MWPRQGTCIEGRLSPVPLRKQALGVFLPSLTPQVKMPVPSTCPSVPSPEALPLWCSAKAPGSSFLSQGSAAPEGVLRQGAKPQVLAAAPAADAGSDLEWSPKKRLGNGQMNEGKVNACGLEGRGPGDGERRKVVPGRAGRRHWAVREAP